MGYGHNESTAERQRRQIIESGNRHLISGKDDAHVADVHRSLFRRGDSQRPMGMSVALDPFEIGPSPLGRADERDVGERGDEEESVEQAEERHRQEVADAYKTGRSYGGRRSHAEEPEPAGENGEEEREGDEETVEDAVAAHAAAARDQWMQSGRNAKKTR